MDNNQHGCPLKFQRFGSKNNFVKLMGSTSRKCITVYENDIGKENRKYCVVICIDQAIPNPINFPSFLLEITNANGSD